MIERKLEPPNKRLPRWSCTPFIHTIDKLDYTTCDLEYKIILCKEITHSSLLRWQLKALGYISPSLCIDSTRFQHRVHSMSMLHIIILFVCIDFNLSFAIREQSSAHRIRLMYFSGQMHAALPTYKRIDDGLHAADRGLIARYQHFKS